MDGLGAEKERAEVEEGLVVEGLVVEEEQGSGSLVPENNT